MPTLPDIKGKVVLDDSQLAKTGVTATKAGAAIREGMTGATGSVSKFGAALSQVMGATGLGGLPQTALKGEQALSGMTSTGVTGMGLLAGGALAAVGIVSAALEHGISQYEQLGNQVENYKRVTGSSAEESSRMVETFNALGVGEDVATQGMFKLSKAIETHDKLLEADGITVKRTADGNVDLAKTLLGVADAYNATADPAKRNKLLFDAFGKSGKDMIPILEQGSAALQQLEEQAALVFTQADLDRLKQEQIQTREADQQWQKMWETLGQKVLPVKLALAESINRGAYEQQKLDEAVRAGTITYDQYSQQQSDVGTKAFALREEWGKQFDASQKVTTALDAQTQSIRDQAAANDALWASTDKVITQEEGQVNAGFALQLSQLAVTESQAKITAAQEAYDKAVKDHGATSDEALLAAGNLTRAQIDQEKAYYAVGAAARKLQEDTDLATSGQKNVAKETQVYVDTLQAEANTLAPDSPLRKQLQAYIDTLKNEIPSDISTRFHVDFMEGGSGSRPGGHGIQAFASGGRPPTGRQIWVGEQGPEIWTPDQPGTITPAGGTPPTPVGGDTITVNGPLVHAESNADAHDIAVDAAWELRKMRRAF